MSELSRRKLLQTSALLSAGRLFGKVPFANAEAFPAIQREAAGEANAIDAIPEIDLGPRERLLFDFDWRFTYGNAYDPARDLGYGEGFENGFSKTGAFRFAKAEYDDSAWRAINLPHDWAVELPFVDDQSLKSHGYKPLGRRYPETSIGWYRRTFDVSGGDAGRRIFIEFDGVFRNALIFCNGAFMGQYEWGYTPFRLDLTDFLNYGGKNAIAVRVDASLHEGWFYEGAGIYRHVWLSKVDPLHLGHWDTVVRTDVRGDSATLSLMTIVENCGETEESCRVHWQILDAGGKVVASADSPAANIPADGRQNFSATVTLRNPAIWSQEKPNLYYAVPAVESNGELRDRDKTVFGVRTLSWDPKRGFALNGKKTTLKGTCNHQDHAGVGSAMPDRLQSYRLEVLKAMGCNAIRTSHNFPTPALVEACDRLGVLVLCETRTMSSNAEAMMQLEKMIKRYRNSPSVFLWSMGNEEWFMQGSLDNDEWHTHEDEAGRVIRSMEDRAHRLDPTRLCTAAVNGYYNTDLADFLDVVGFNYNYQRADDYRREHPTRLLIGTETGSDTCTRGIYATDRLRNWVSSYDDLQPNTQLDQERVWWRFYAERPWLSGGFMWTGFDYRGEPTPYAWPSISSQFGVVDTCGFPKDSFFYYQASWRKEPVLHLFPHWNWEGREGEEIRVQVESNLDSVELFLNGQSLGTKKVQPCYPLEWKLRYTPGSVEARGTRGGEVILIRKRETAGAPAQIRLSADRTGICADGQDVALVRVEVVDKEGRPVPTADNLIQFKVRGEGALIGVGNGDPNCHESDKGEQRSLFNGLAQAVVQSTRSPGCLTIQAGSAGLASATLMIATKASKGVPTVD